jgi:hypothetical protein
LLTTARCATAQAAADPAPGLLGEYFTYKTNGYVPDLPDGAKPFLVRVDPQINFPDPGTGGDFHHTKLVYDFAVRWTGVLRIDKPGTYTLFTQSDDGARLAIDGKVLVENDGPHPLSEKSAKVQLTSGDHPIKLEFAQGGGGSAMMLLWQPPGGEKQLVPAGALFHDRDAENVQWDRSAWNAFQLGGERTGASAARKQDNSPWGRMDYGPFLSHTITAAQPADNTALKGVAIKLDGGRAGVLFDTGLLRYSAAWTGGFLKLRGVAFDGDHGPNPEVAGKISVATGVSPGWARGGSFADPRPRPFGPLPRDWARYKGLYRHGDKVVLSYTVGATDVLELPGVEGAGDDAVFTRTLRIGATDQPMRLLVAEMDGGATPAAEPGSRVAVLQRGDSDVAVGLAGVPGGPTVAADRSAHNTTLFHVTLPPHREPMSIVLPLWGGDKAGLGKAKAALSQPRKAQDLEALTRGGPSLWPQTVTVVGKLGDAANAPYVVDTIPVPENNPYRSWIRFGGFDFFPDGKSAAACTWSGDVWVVSGIDDKLQKLTWKRFATGLFQPLGLKIVDGKVYVHGRDQVTRLHDLNNDGEADFYENFNNDVKVTPGFHEFAFDLHTDPAGNFYFAKAGPVNPGGGGFGKSTAHNGSLMRVSKDGSKLDVVATGFRAPNGIGVGPDGQITTGDNQGTWTPACRLNWIKPGGFYGVVDLAHRQETPTQTDNPLCWLPYTWDNSSGSQVWVTSDRWGEAFKGDLLHLSYGKCRLFKVLIDSSDPQNVQGGVVRFPPKFDSGAMRARMNPADGQLYVCGLRGWQSEAATDACFQRVRYTGKPVYMADGMKVRKDGIELTFTQPLNPDVANDAGSFGVEQWNYRWTGEYGSDEYSAKDPGKKGHDTVEVKSAKLLPDGKTMFLEIEGLKPVMQMLIKYDLEAKDGTVMRDEVACTLNKVGDEKMVVSSGK